MSTTVTTTITHKYLMGKSKSDLAHEFLLLCDMNAKLHNQIENVTTERDALKEKINLYAKRIDLLLNSTVEGLDNLLLEMQEAAK